MPFGTRNHFARDVGLDRDDPIAALDAFEGGRERRVDVGRVNGRAFLNNVSLGLYAQLVHRREGHRRRREALARLRALALLARDHSPLGLTVDGEPVETHVALVANNDYQLDLFSLGERERVDEGRLHLYLAHGMLPGSWEERSARALRDRLRTAGGCRPRSTASPPRWRRRSSSRSSRRRYVCCFRQSASTSAMWNAISLAGGSSSGRNHAELADVVRRLGLAADEPRRPVEVQRRVRVLVGAVAIHPDAEELAGLDLEPGLLAQLPAQGVERVLALLEEAARQIPVALGGPRRRAGRAGPGRRRRCRSRTPSASSSPRRGSRRPCTPRARPSSTSMVAPQTRAEPPSAELGHGVQR